MVFSLVFASLAIVFAVFVFVFLGWSFCNWIDAELLRRRALYEKLERCLWRFSMENGGSGNYYPVLNRITRRWSITCAEIQRFGPSFKTREACARAIEEVIKPILHGVEDEIFVWEGV